ncbi:hypothetical protein D3C76_1421670 [compost metagenome]
MSTQVATPPTAIWVNTSANSRWHLPNLKNVLSRLCALLRILRANNIFSHKSEGRLVIFNVSTVPEARAWKNWMVRGGTEFLPGNVKKNIFSEGPLKKIFSNGSLYLRPTEKQRSRRSAFHRFCGKNDGVFGFCSDPASGLFLPVYPADADV